LRTSTDEQSKSFEKRVKENLSKKEEHLNELRRKYEEE
jgi:hypothetical protein